MDKKINILSNTITTLDTLKEYLNNMQTLNANNLFELGFKIGIVLSEINLIQQDLVELHDDLQENK